MFRDKDKVGFFRESAGIRACMRLAALFGLTFISFPGNVFGAEYNGLLSVEDYYSSDSSSAYDYHILTTRLRLDARDLNEAKTLAFHFSGRQRSNLSDRDYSSRVKSERIDAINIEYTGIDRFYLAAGRLWPKDLPVAERIDGINVIYQQSNTGVGLFGGIKPDPYTDEFNSDYSSAGGYVFYREKTTFANLAFTHNSYKGETDREYLYGQVSYSPLTVIRLYGTATADLNQVTNNIELTNGILEVSYRPGFGRNVTVGYNRFKAFRYYKSMQYDPVDSDQQSYYVRGDYRFRERYSVYGNYRQQMQEYQSYIPETKKSDMYQLGFRNDNLMGSLATVDISATTNNSYSSTSDTYNIEATRLFYDSKLQMVLNGAYTQTEYDMTDYTDSVMTYGASGYLSLSKTWRVSLSVDRTEGTNYSTSTVSSRLTARF